MTEAWPAVRIQDEFAFRLDDDRLQNTAWVGHAHHHRNAVLGILDSAVESPGWELRLVYGNAGGRDWRHLGELRKPYYLATFSGLEQTRDRGFCITVELADDYGAGISPGAWEACSIDEGATWSGWSLRGQGPRVPSGRSRSSAAR